jgi:hypothetical protein
VTGLTENSRQQTTVVSLQPKPVVSLWSSGRPSLVDDRESLAKKQQVLRCAWLPPRLLRMTTLANRAGDFFPTTCDHRPAHYDYFSTTKVITISYLCSWTLGQSLKFDICSWRRWIRAARPSRRPETNSNSGIHASFSTIMASADDWIGSVRRFRGSRPG